MGLKRIAGWVFGIMLLAIVILAGGGWVFIHTAPVKRFLLEKATAKAESSIGSKVHIGAMSLGWSHLSFEFRNVTILGREGPAQPAFFTVQRASAQVDLLPLLRKKVHLRFVRLDQPVIRFLIDQNGNSNIPHPRNSNAHRSTIRTLLSLEVWDFALRSGEIELRDKKIPLSAELHNLRSQLKFDTGRQAYEGSIAYAHGTFSSGTLPATEHGLQARFALSDSALDLHPVNINFGHSRFDANVQLKTASPFRLSADYHADLFADDISGAIGTVLPVRGEFRTTGKLGYHSKAGATFAESLDAAGEVLSRAVTVHYREIAPDVRDAHAQYRLSGGALRVWNVSGRALGGVLSGNFETPHVESHPRWNAHATLQGANLSALDRVAETEYQAMRRVGLVGIASIGVDLNGGRSGTQLHALVTIQNPAQQPPRGAEIPLAGAVDVRYDSAKGAATFRQSHLEVGASRVSLSGTLSRTADLNVQATTTDLHQLTVMVTDIAQQFHARRTNACTFSTTTNLHGLIGDMQFTGAVTGSVKSPHIQGHLTAQRLQFDGTSWRSLGVSFSLSSSQVVLQEGLLQNSSGAQVNFGGQIGLQKWRIAPQSKIQFHGALRGISITEAEHIAKKTYPIAGTLDANFTTFGVKSNLSGSGQFFVRGGSFWNQQVDSLRGKVLLARQSVKLDAQAEMHAGRIFTRLEYELNSKRFQASVTMPALNLAQIQLAAMQTLGVSGILKGSASGQGTIEQPSASGSFEVVNLQLRGQTISKMQARFQLTGKHATVWAMASEANTEARLTGDIDLQGQYPLHARLDAPSLSLGPLLANHTKGASQIQGQTSIHISVDGPFKNAAAVHMHVSIPTLTVAYENVHLQLARPLNVDYANGVATINPTEVKGMGADLKIAGRIPIRSRAATPSLAVKGTVDLSALESLSPSVQSSGQVQIDLSAQGGAGSFASQFRGQVRVMNASVFAATSPLGLEKLNAVFQLSNERVDIKQFNAQIGGGTLAVEGSIGLRHDAPFDIALQGNRMRIRYPHGIRSLLTANLQCNGTAAASQLSGRVLLDELSFTQQFDMATLMSSLSGNTVASTASPFMEQMKLNISLQSTRELRLASSQLSMAGSTNLNIIGTAADPVILGRVALTGGTMFFMGKRYQVQSGTISFANPARTEPVVDVYVQTTVRQYDITLNFVGPIDRLRTSYTSVPPLSPSDIINLLAFGKTTEEAAAAGSTPASVGAESVVARGVGSQISGKLQNLTGLSQLTISPTAGGNQTGPGAQIGIQEQVTGSLLLTFSTDVTATQNTAVQVQYSATQHVSVSVLRDQNGGYALDIRIRKAF